jgi:hypothetical protein
MQALPPKAENEGLIGPFNAFLYAPELSQAYFGLLDMEEKEWSHRTELTTPQLKRKML